MTVVLVAAAALIGVVVGVLLVLLWIALRVDMWGDF